MIDAEDLFLGEGIVEQLVEIACAGEIPAEGFFDNDALPAGAESFGVGAEPLMMGSNVLGGVER